MSAPATFWAEALALADGLDGVSYYQLLALAPDAPQADVRGAYTRRVTLFHPDRHTAATASDPARKRALVALQARLNEAYWALSNPTRRADYDRALAAGQRRLVAGATPPPPAVDPANPQAKRYLTMAAQAERSGDLKDAAMYLGFAQQLEPTSPAILAALARVVPGARPAPAPAPIAAPPPEPVAPPPRAATPPPVPARAATPPPVPPRTATAPVVAVPRTATASSPGFVVPRTSTVVDIGPARAAPPPELGVAAPAAVSPPAPRTVRLRCRNWEHFLTLHARGLGRGAMFVKTPAPFEAGTRVTFTVVVPNDDELVIATEVSSAVTGDDRAGMELRFQLAGEQARHLEALVAIARASAP